MACGPPFDRLTTVLPGRVLFPRNWRPDFSLCCTVHNVIAMTELICVDPDSPPVPFTDAARGEESWVVNARFAYIDALIEQARNALIVGADVRWVSSAADAFSRQLTDRSAAVEALQTSVDQIRVKFAALEQIAADAARVQAMMSAHGGYQPLSQGWHG